MDVLRRYPSFYVGLPNAPQRADMELTACTYTPPRDEDVACWKGDISAWRWAGFRALHRHMLAAERGMRPHTMTFYRCY